MKRRSTFASSSLFALLAAGSARLAAQSLIHTHGTLVGYTNMPAPGVPGATLTVGFTPPVADDAGNVVFRGLLTGGGVTLNDNFALLHGPDVAGLSIFARENGAAPGLPGVVMFKPGGDTPGSACRLTNDGRTVFTSHLAGAGVTTANDSALFVGPLGAQVVAVRQGDAAPGTLGASFSGDFSGLIETQLWSNLVNHVMFWGTLSGGDVVGSTNNLGIWAGPLGAHQLAFRTGMSLPGGAVLGSINGNTQALNSAGLVRLGVVLSTTLGTPPATTMTDDALLQYIPGTGVAFSVREGDPAAGTVGALFGDASGVIPFYISHRGFSTGGQTLVSVILRSGDVVTGVNDRALYMVAPGSQTLVMRKGDLAPGTGGGTFGAVANFANNLNSSERPLFMAQVFGGTLGFGYGLFGGAPGALSPIAVTGDPAPGTAGAQLQITPNLAVSQNDADEIYFDCPLLAGVGDTTPANNQMIVHWGPSTGLRRVLRKGDVLTLPTGSKVVDSWIISNLGSGDTASTGCKESGLMALIVYFPDGTEAIYVIDPPNAGEAFCASDGSLLDHTTPCPCANTGAAGNGCAHSFSASGANLTTTGSANADDVVLIASNLPTSAFTLFMQHDAPGDTVFHDGVLCAGGTLVRLRGRNASAGIASFPNSLFANDVTTTLSQRGGVTIGSGALRFYAAYYRNASTTFCPPATANVSNGWRITW